MFDIKEKDIMGQTNKLLYNIWQELKKEAKEEKYICKTCKTEYDNKGS